ncbi:mesoderm-specific transcript homolog protein-like [Antedon mediterranea]|uniref:mesoderm-specific transcript homolog protein-like n=1 Tax=Antedon mediterranea TaxID=105859 RepID=UPI003AF67148
MSLHLNKSYLLLLSTCVAAIAVFLNYPPPPLSDTLKKWKQSGKMFNFQNNNIFYHDYGNENNEDVLVCIHGFPTSSFDFIKILPDLQNIFGRVIVADMLGFGFSDKPKVHNYTVFEQADIITYLLKSLSINKVNILAHDLGDTIAQEILARFEDGEKDRILLQSVTLLNGGILPETNFPKIIQKLLLNKYLSPVLMRLTNYVIFKQSFSDVFGENTKPSEEELADFWSANIWNDGYLVTADLLQYINQRHANRDRWVHVLQNTTVPLHLIYGPSDPINGPETFLKRFRKLVPNCSVDVLNTSISHYPHWEDPKNVSKHFKNFIKPILLSNK